MGRARGSNANLNAKFEAAYGTPPGGNYKQLPFVQSTLGAEQPLIQSDLLGQGREGFDPTLDVVTNAGDVTVPVDARAFGYWLRLLFGDAVMANSGKAHGDIVFAAQPANNSTITMNGTLFTFVAAAPAGNQIQIGVDLTTTLDNAVAALNASVVGAVAQATYSKVGGDTLHIQNDAAGVAGNAYTLAVSATSKGTPSGATLAGGTVKHTFTSGADALPSMSIETAMPDVPSFEMNYGARANTLKIDAARKGLLNAVISLIAKGAAAPLPDTGAGVPDVVIPARFAQATGQITKDGQALGSVVSASVSYSNNLQAVETIAPDGEIEDADPGMSTAMGNVVVNFKDLVLVNAATGSTPVALTFGWTFQDFTLTFTVPRVFLPRPKRPINGPGGIQAQFDWQASGAGGHTMTVDLVSDVADFAA